MQTRPYKYILTPELLLYSKNPKIQALVQNNFTLTRPQKIKIIENNKEISKEIKVDDILANYPAKDPNPLTVNLLVELMGDYGSRGLDFEGQKNPNWEKDLIVHDTKKQREILDFLISHFGLTNTKRRLQHYSQLPQYDIGSSTLSHNISPDSNLFFITPQSDNDKVREKNSTREARVTSLYSFAGKSYYKTTLEYLSIQNITNANICRGTGPCESLFQLTEHGDKLVYLAVDDQLHFDLLMGVYPNDKRWPDLKFSRTGMLISLPLFFYFENYLHHTFNADNRSDSELAAFFGWPSRGTAYEKVVSVLFFPVMFVKAFAKLFFEAIPALVQAAGDFLLDRCMKILALPKTERTTRTTILAGIGAFVGALLYVGGGIPRFAARCVLSPVDAAKETYSACFRASRRLGFSEKISKGVGIVGAAVSMAVSGAAWTFIAIAALPVLPAVGIYLAAKGAVGKAIATGLSKAGSWIINAFNWFGNPAIAAGTAVSATSTLHAVTSAAADKISAPPSAPAPIPTIAPAAPAPELNGTKNINETLAAAAKEAEKTTAAVATQIPEQPKKEVGTNGATIATLPEATFAHTEATPPQDLPAPRKSFQPG